MSEIKLQNFIKPEDIETESFRIIDSEVSEPRLFQGKKWQIVRRMIHTTADFEMIDLVRFHEKALESGVNALRNGATIVTTLRWLSVAFLCVALNLSVAKFAV